MGIGLLGSDRFGIKFLNSGLDITPNSELACVRLCALGFFSSSNEDIFRGNIIKLRKTIDHTMLLSRLHHVCLKASLPNFVRIFRHGFFNKKCYVHNRSLIVHYCN